MEQLIDDLGGNAALAKALNRSPNAISNWRKRGIPWKVRPTVARLAAEKAVALPTDFWGVSA